MKRRSLNADIKATLRGILDLDVPENRYTVEARQQMTG